MYTVGGLVTPEECSDFVADAHRRGFADAPITTPLGFVRAPGVRNNTRVMYDDTDLAAELWRRLEPNADREFGPWRAVGLNERFRLYRYEESQYFRWHRDGHFRRSTNERSFMTVMLYLSDDFEGGTTDFKGGGEQRVVPETGTFLLFDHRLQHQGSPVKRGVKYVLRTDLMYRRE